MTQLYLRSTGGSDADDGLSWANAKATMAGAITAAAAGDRIAVRNDHSQSVSGTWAFPGTNAAPNIVTGVSDSGEPPTTLATGAVLGTPTNGALTITGSVIMSHLKISVGTGANNAILTMANSNAADYQVYETCTFGDGATGNGTGIAVGREGNATGNRLVWRDCTVHLTASAQYITVRQLDWEWNGGTVAGSTPTTLMEINSGIGRGATIQIRNVDFSPYGSTFNICSGMPGGNSLLMEKCKFPASWSGNLINGTPSLGGRAVLLDCQISGGSKIRYRLMERTGTINDDTSIYRDGGSQDEGTAISFKMATTSNAAYPTAILQSPPIIVDNQTTGSAVTLYAEIVHDSATALTDADVWAVADYLGTASSDLGSSVTTRCALLASASSVASSSETWTGTGGMSNPNKQRIAVTFTPQVAGDVMVRVYLAKASKTLYLCGEVHA